jgi:predicted transcriptional regulator of viral defense system
MAKSPPADDQPLVALVDALQARGRYVFTREEVLRRKGRSPVAVEAALRRLKRRGRIASPRRGFYVIVPLEYREAGCPPASWFIDELMRFLGQPYYVGLLAAAAIHGAAHQQPMLFQVVTDRATRRAEAGRVRIQFHKSRGIASVPVQEIDTETGRMRVATPEATAYDLVRFASAAGHLSNVATVLRELAEKLDHKELARLAGAYGAPDTQRLGYLLDRLGERAVAEALARGLEGQRVRTVLLAPRQRRGRAKRDERWKVIPNAAFEVDV